MQEKEARKRIRTISPELHIDSIRRNADGMINELFIVNETWVYRFARDQFGIESLQRELHIFQLLGNRLAVNIPHPVHHGEDWVLYHYLPGRMLTRQALNGLPESVQQNLAEQVGNMLGAIHTTPAPEDLHRSPAYQTPDQWKNLFSAIREEVFPDLMTHQRAWAEELFSFLDDGDHVCTQQCLVHGDVGAYHVLFDLTAEPQLNGLIDFGIAGLGDPANDFSGLIQYYGLPFVQRMAAVYPNLENILPRAVFYAQMIELQWILNSLHSPHPLWLITAHLGNARGGF